MALEIWSVEFLCLIIIAFSIVMLLAGILAAAFGAGKAKGYGGLMCIVGIVMMAILIWLTGYSDITVFNEVSLWDVFMDGVINLLGILVGALIAVGIFLAVVLKS
jgi:hypothetical protein